MRPRSRGCPKPEPTGALAQTLRVPLDSSYLFQEGLSGAPPPARGPTAEQQLKPYDNVLILRRPGWALQRLVALTGQVQHPGRYALTSKTERLSSLIARAGGLTTEAYPGGSSSTAAQPIPLCRNPRRRSQPCSSAAARRVRRACGLDLPLRARGLGLAGQSDSGRRRLDPRPRVRSDRDRHRGSEFARPGRVRAGKNLDWYVSAAGGYAQNGDRKRAYVTQPDGKKAAVKRRFFFSDDVPDAGPRRRDPGSRAKSW